MKMSMVQAINAAKNKASEWMALHRRALASGQGTPRLFFVASAVVRSLARTALGVAASVPLQIWLAAAALLFAGLWLEDHDAKVREAAELRQAGQQAAQRVAALEAQAEAALRQANENNAAVVAQLETRRHALAQQASNLAAQLEALRQKQAARQAKLVALPASELARNLSDQLGPSSVVRGPLPESPHTVTGSSVARANEAAVRTPPLQPSAASPQLATDNGQLTLSEPGQRIVASALAERDACREHSAIQDKLVANCGQRVAAGEAEIRAQADSLAKLNVALSAKNKILAEREAEHRAELRAARGTWRSRAWRAMKWIGAGVVVGQLIR